MSVSKKPNPATPRGYATVEEAAAYLSCSERTVRRRIETGRLKAFTLGGVHTLRVRWSDLDAIMAPLPTVGGAR